MEIVLALVMLFTSKLLPKILEGKPCLDSKSNDLIDVQMMEEAKKFIIRMVRKKSFRTEVKTMTNNEKNEYVKVKLSHSKQNSFYLHQWQPFKNDEKCFLFHLKSSFHSQDV